MISLNKHYLLVGLLLISACGSDDDGGTPVVENCDSAIAIDNSDPLNAAAAMEFCNVSGAAFIRANGADRTHSNQYGIVNQFGTIQPRAGERMLLLSSGFARSTTQAGPCGSSSCATIGAGIAPDAALYDDSGCFTAPNVFDDAGIRLTFTVPDNARGFSIDFAYFTFDYPDNSCTSFSDDFLILLDETPADDVNQARILNVGVESDLLDPANTAFLSQTGFDVWGTSASTGWARATVPAAPGSTITLKLVIYDAGDNSNDSSVLLDNFQWLASQPVFGAQAL